MRKNNILSIFYNKFSETGYIYNNETNRKYFLSKPIYMSFLFLLNKKDTNNSSISIKSLKIVEKFCKDNRIPLSRDFIKINEFYAKIPLQTIQLEITNKCNLRCKHCYLGEYEENIDYIMVESLISQAKDMGVVNFDITGGEPLLYPEIEKILSKILEMGMKIVVFTNAVRLPQKVKLLIDKYYGIQFKISLDGWDAESHDYIRGRGTYKKTIENIKTIKNSNVPVSINVVLNSKNIIGVNKFQELSKELNTPFIYDRFLPFVRNDFLSITDEEYINTITKIEGFQRQCNSVTVESSNLESYYCEAGNSYVYIRSNGDVVFCPTLSSSGFCGGNIFSENLSTIWNDSTFFNHIRGVRCRYYSECPVNYFCQGGCRSRGGFFSGDIGSPDIQECKLAYKITGILPTSMKKHI